VSACKLAFNLLAPTARLDCTKNKKAPPVFSAWGFSIQGASQTSATNTSAIRILNAAPVSVGFTQEDDGMTLVPAMNRLEWS